MKQRLKTVIGVSIIFVLFAIISSLPLSYLFQSIPLFVFIFFFVSMIAFGEGETFGTFSLLFFGAIIVGIVFLWISQTNLPGTEFRISDQSIIALFTIVLAISTIINIIISNRSMKMSRVTNVDFYLINDTFDIQIKNLGPYSARAIKLEMEVFQDTKTKLTQKFKDFINVETRRVGFLAPSKGKYESFKDFLSKRIGVVVEENDYGDSTIRPKDRHQKAQYTLMLRLNYKTDHLFRVPFPQVRRYKISVTEDQVNVKDIS